MRIKRKTILTITINCRVQYPVENISITEENSKISTMMIHRYISWSWCKPTILLTVCQIFRFLYYKYKNHQPIRFAVMQARNILRYPITRKFKGTGTLNILIKMVIRYAPIRSAYRHHIFIMDWIEKYIFEDVFHTLCIKSHYSI